MGSSSSLWGEEFSIKETPSLSIDKILSEINNPKQLKVEKVIKSKSVDIREKIRFITENVYRILGRYKENT